MVGNRLRDVRQSQRLSLTTVASKAKISAATLSRIETNKQAVDLGLFLSLTKVLKVNPRDLLADESADENPLVTQLAGLDSGSRAKFWRELSTARKAQRNTSRRADIRQLSEEVEELLAQIDFMRGEIENVRLRLRKRVR
jgi:transcriptional regulator with XRE-family HTH domain